MDKNRCILSEIAEIRLGFQFRRKIDSARHGQVKVIQMTNIIENSQIDRGGLLLVDKNDVNSSHFLKVGDVLFCARGVNNYAIEIDTKINSTIAVSQFLIIRADQQKAIPAFISWYLNQNPAQAYFKSNSLTGTVPLINKRTLENLQMPLPPLEKQKFIAKFAMLKQKEFELVNQIMEKKKTVYDKILMEII